jgi:hypothetical protein
VKDEYTVGEAIRVALKTNVFVLQSGHAPNLVHIPVAGDLMHSSRQDQPVSRVVVAHSLVGEVHGHGFEAVFLRACACASYWFS